MQKVSEIILKLGNTKASLQDKNLTGQIINNYNIELSNSIMIKIIYYNILYYDKEKCFKNSNKSNK